MEAHQFLEDNVDLKALANKINDMLLGVTENFSPLPQQNEKIEVPVELLATVQEVQFSLKSIKLSKSVGPDNLPNKVLKEFAPELATVIQDIYNQSWIEGYVPQLLTDAPLLLPYQKKTLHKQLKKICARYHLRALWRCDGRSVL